MVSALWQKNDMKGLWYLLEEHDYFSTRMHTRERAGDALLRTMLVKSIRTLATLIDVNFHVITKAWFPLVIRIVIIGDSIAILRTARFTLIVKIADVWDVWDSTFKVEMISILPITS